MEERGGGAVQPGTAPKSLSEKKNSGMENLVYADTLQVGTLAASGSGVLPLGSIRGVAASRILLSGHHLLCLSIFCTFF